MFGTLMHIYLYRKDRLMLVFISRLLYLFEIYSTLLCYMLSLLLFSGLVPLHNACSYGHYEVTQLLIEVSFDSGTFE